MQFWQRSLVFASAALGVWACARNTRGNDDVGVASVVRNAGFEENGGPMPIGWTFEKKAANKGIVTLASQPVHSGSHALKLSPNERNLGTGIVNNPLGVGQAFLPGRFRGKKVYITGWLGAEGGAIAVVGLYALTLTGGVEFVELKQSVSTGLKYHEDAFSVPKSLRVLFVIVNCHVEGTSGAGYFDDISVSLDPPRAPVTPERLEASTEIDAAHELRHIPDQIFGTNVEWIWDGNGLWNPSAGRLDPTLVGLTRDLGVSRIRFPGGIFADFYHWRDGIGPPDRRPFTLSMPGGVKSRNAFGIDEALDFSKQTGAALVMTVNIVTGTPVEAVELLRYVRSRCAQTGAPQVVNWELGNEPYVHDGSLHAKAGGMTPEHYAEVYLEFARALKSADPSIRLGAVADENYSTVVPGYAGWTETILKRIGASVDFLSVHNAYAPAVIDARGKTVREVYGAMLAAPLQVATALDKTSDKIARFAGPGSERIGIAITEWGPFFHIAPESPWVDHVKTLGSAIYVASALKVFVSTPRVEAADFFKLNEQLFMGWIGERNGQWTPKAPYYAFQMFRRHFGSRLVASNADSPYYSSHTAGWTAGMPQVPYVETAASKSDDGKTLYLVAINKNMDSAIPLTITVRNTRILSRAVVWTLSGRSVDANTGTQLPSAGNVHWARQAEDEKEPRFYKGGPGEIDVDSRTITVGSGHFTVSLPKLSVTSLEMPIQ